MLPKGHGLFFGSADWIQGCDLDFNSSLVLNVTQVEIIGFEAFTNIS